MLDEPFFRECRCYGYLACHHKVNPRVFPAIAWGTHGGSFGSGCSRILLDRHGHQARLSCKSGLARRPGVAWKYPLRPSAGSTICVFLQLNHYLVFLFYCIGGMKGGMYVRCCKLGQESFPTGSIVILE